MQDFRTTAHVSTIGPRTARPVVPIRTEADELLREHATAYTRLVQAILATAPNGDFGDLDESNDYVVRTLTRVYNEAADRQAGVDDLTALMDAVAEPAPARRMQLVAGGAR